MLPRKKRKTNPTNNEGEGLTDDIIFHNLNNISYKVHCDFCDKEITKHTKILCAECPDLDICVNCFSTGAENEKHSKNHSYHVINKLNFPLFDENWTADDELLLLEGLEKCGFGNWIDIAEHIGTKTPEEVDKHYEKYYTSQKKGIPNVEILSKRDANNNLIIITVPSKAKKMEEEIETKKTGRKNNTKGGVIPDKKEPAASQQISQLSAPLNAQTQNKDGGSSASEIIGYMPLRGDFDFEYDNEAELLLAEMEFNDDDKPDETALKHKILEIYNARLDERIKRKDFVKERDMLNFKKQNAFDRTKSKEEKEIYNLLKIFARFNTQQDHEELVQGIIKEKMLRTKIEELRFAKKIGLKTYEELELYMQEKKKKDEAYQKKQKQNDIYLFDPKINTNRFTPRRTRYNGKDTMESKEASDKKNKANFSQLNEKEHNLCESLSITPYDYILIKEVLVRECLKDGLLSKDIVNNIIKIDKERSTAIFDFLVSNRLICEKQEKPQKA
jgi:transcriptional adapter 2-alpha